MMCDVPAKRQTFDGFRDIPRDKMKPTHTTFHAASNQKKVRRDSNDEKTHERKKERRKCGDDREKREEREK